MKKLLSVLLVMAVVMSFATVMSVSADEKEDLVAAGASQDVETAAADDFLAFLQTPEVLAIFENYMFIINE